MNFYALTDTGKIRQNNEDSYFVKSYENTHLFALVADGMGGHNGGECASKIAVDIISESFELFSQSKDADHPRKIKQNMISSIKKANTAIFEKAGTSPELRGMGTTAVMCYVKDNTAYVLNVGDSRLYHISDDIAQITKDHSYVNELVERGVLQKEDAQNHPQKNLITRALGTEPDVESDLYEFKIKSGDCILLCSDGLTNMISDEEILNVINDNSDRKKALEILMNSANENGGKDNITAVIINI